MMVQVCFCSDLASRKIQDTNKGEILRGINPVLSTLVSFTVPIAGEYSFYLIGAPSDTIRVKAFTVI